MSRALIANVTSGANLRKLIQYDLVGRDSRNPRRGAELLASNFATSDLGQITNEFEKVLAQRKDCKKPLYRTSLSIPAGVSWSRLDWIATAKLFMQTLGMGPDLPWILTHHSDTEHPHVHLIVGRIPFNANSCLPFDSERRPCGGSGLWTRPFQGFQEGPTRVPESGQDPGPRGPGGSSRASGEPRT